MEGSLFKDFVKGAYGLTFIVFIGRVWEHWNADKTEFYGLNFVMVDRKVNTLHTHYCQNLFFQNVPFFKIMHDF